MENIKEIQLDISVLSSAANRLQEMGEDLRLVSSDMKQVIQDLSLAWKGDSSQHFAARVEEHIGSMQQNADFAQQLSSSLNQLVQEVIRLEQMLAAQME